MKKKESLRSYVIAWEYKHGKSIYSFSNCRIIYISSLDFRNREGGVKMTDIQTADLSRFGYRELDEAGVLLKAYAEDQTDFLNEGLTLNFNANSGIVFLSDEDYNVGVLEDGKVVQFFSCAQCGYEGTQADAVEDEHDFEGNEGYCSKKCKKENE